MDTLQIILLSICTLLAIIFIIIRAKIGGLMGFLFKTLASFGFVASAIISISYMSIANDLKLSISLIIIGLLLGLIGDMLLDLKVIYNNDKIFLNSGMLSFGLGHLCYFSAFSLYANYLSVDLLTPILISVGGGIILTIAIILSSKKMHLDFGDYLWQSVAYTFILTFMTIFTFVLILYGGGKLITFIGMILFFASDVILSLQYFGGKINDKLLIIINHTLYYSAQILILATLMLM